MVACAVSVLPTPARAAGTPIPPPPAQYVTDTAGFLSPKTTRELSRYLEQYAATTGHQIVVWIGRTTGGVPIEEWAVKAFEAWRIGRKGLDDGVLLVIMAEDRKLRFEVGYGLEGDVTDAVSARIIREQMVPKIQAGDRDGAVLAGITALLKTIGGETAAGRPPAERRAPSAPSFLQTVLLMIVGLIVLLFVITHPGLALTMLWALSSGGRGGGGGGWGGGGSGNSGGGFSGGGGRSGGGGASGSW